MRILLPTMRDPGQIGGTSTHIAMLTQGLVETGHEVSALYLGETFPAPVRKAALVWPAGVLNRFRTGWGMVYAAEIRGRLLAARTQSECARALEEGTPWEVLNAQEVYSVPYLRRVADEYGVPLVLTLHGYPLYESVSEGYTTASSMGKSYLMRAELRALRMADAVVTVDSRLYRHALRLVPERADSVYTLMNFIDTSTFSPLDYPEEEARLRRELRAAWNIAEGKTVLLCPRRLVKKNGVVLPSLALAAMKSEERDRFLLLHAGEGGERQEMERIITANGLAGNVRLLGGQGREAILELFRLADIVLVPSVHSENVEEATSLSALEAMASGRPLIAGNVGGLAEMVVEGETGLLVPADPQALAAAILRLAAAPDLGARMAAAARDYVVRKHSHLRAAAAYAEVYGRTAEGIAATIRASAAGPAPAAATPASAAGLVPAAARPPTPETVPTAAGAAAEANIPAPPATPAPPVTPAAAAASVDPLADARPISLPQRPWQSLSVLGFTLDVVTLEQASQWVIETARESSRRGRHDRDVAPSRAAAAATGRAEVTAGDAGLCYRTRIAVSFNPELVVRAEGDPVAAEALLSADLCYPDGVGAVWAAGRQGGGPGPAGQGLQRVAGVDLAERVLELAAQTGLSVFFLGAAPGVAGEAARRQRERSPDLRIAGTHHGYFSVAEEADVVRKVRDSRADVLLVAMGAPRQEILLYAHRLDWGAGVGLGIGGSFDVWAGTAKRAPAWAQKAKIEWLYRLARDPRRVRRQLALPRYAAQVVRWSPDDYGPPRRGRARLERGGEAEA